MIELALIVATLALLFGAILFLMNLSGKAGENKKTIDDQKRTIQELQKANEDMQSRAELDSSIPVDGAARRLQDGPWTRD